MAVVIVVDTACLVFLIFKTYKHLIITSLSFVDDSMIKSELQGKTKTWILQRFLCWKGLEKIVRSIQCKSK